MLYKCRVGGRWGEGICSPLEFWKNVNMDYSGTSYKVKATPEVGTPPLLRTLYHVPSVLY